MGCGDSRLPLTSEEALIQREEAKLRLSSLSVAFVCATIKKYSHDDQVTDSQLTRIVERLNLAEDDPTEYKKRYFDQFFVNMSPKGFGRGKMTVWGVMFSAGSNGEKVKELFFGMNADLEGSVDKLQVEEMVKIMLSISTVYSPNLVKSESNTLSDFKRALQRKFSPVSLAITDSITSSSPSISLRTLQDRFNSPHLSRLLTPTGVRTIVLEFKTDLASITHRPNAGMHTANRTLERGRTARSAAYQ